MHITPEPGGAFTLTYTLTASVSANAPASTVDGTGFHPSTCSVTAAVGSYSVKILTPHLTAPDPSGHPETGDGTNQFVYDTTTSKGYLFLPGTISIAGANHDETNWFLNDLHYAQSSHVGLKFDLPADSTLLSYGWQIGTGQIIVKRGDQLNLDDVAFQGLPNANSGFGNHLETLTIDGNPYEPAHIQTFFTGTASNYPGADTDKTNNGFDTPNWYHYYNVPYPATGAYEPNSTEHAYSWTSPQSPYTIRIHDGAYGTYRFNVFCLSNPIITGEKLKLLGQLEVTGIDCYIYTCAHELGHKTLLVQGGVYDVDASGNPTGLSGDGDQLIDTWEDAHHMNSLISNTADYPNLPVGDVVDNEILADIPALKAVLDSKDMWDLDWAQPGLQYTGGTPLYFYPKPTGTQEGFYWNFYPADGSASFHVHSQADLEAHYPKKTVLTAISQLGP